MDLLKQIKNVKQIRIDYADPKVRYIGACENETKLESEKCWLIIRETKLAGITHFKFSCSVENMNSAWATRSSYFPALDPASEVLGDPSAVTILGTVPVEVQNQISVNANPIVRSTRSETIITPAIVPGLAGVVEICPADPNIVMRSVYNNSTNSAQVGPTNTPNTNMLVQLASNTGPTAGFLFYGASLWTGKLFAMRNAGSGPMYVTNYYLV